MKNNQKLKSTVLSSLFWKLMERGGTQGIQFIVQIVLARLLLPEDFGLIAIVTIFILLANVFVQSGFNTALIQKKDADDEDFSSVFYLSFFVAGLLYVVLFLTSPFISVFYRSPQLILILRVLSVTLFFGAFNSIQNAYVARNMMFKKLFFSSLGAIIISGTVGIATAYLGWGVWALVAQQLTNQLAVTLILWFTVKWRPKLLFSIEKVKVLFSFGWKLLASSLINTLYMEIRSLIIGKIYIPAMLGFYDRGQQIPKVIVSNIDGAIQSVMLPALASQQDDKKRVKAMMRRAIMTSSFIMFPMMVGLAVVAEPVVKIILTDKWLPAVPFLQIFCASYSLWPIHTANLQAINALGRSDIFLKLEIIKKVIGIIILGVSIPFGIYAIAWGVLISGVISTFINAYPNLKLLNYSYIEQWKDIMPSLGISLVMGAVVYTLNFLNIAVWQILMLQVFVGVVIYIGLAKVFKVESFGYLVKTTREIIEGRKKVYA
ncbi:MAG: lipopolysaccharide biosynthesis protein [Thermoanaerobacterales bacterium]|nr:lipopolysaccharide biosynthesis protein [Thermoanaerobacterales bacterium]